MKNENHIIFFTHIKKDSKNEVSRERKNESMFSRIKTLDFHTKNEIYISNILKNILNYNDHFHIILKYSFVNISEVDKTLGIIKREKKDQYIHCSYSFHSINRFSSLDSFFLETKNNRKIVLNMINSFKYLIKSLEILWKNEIVHFMINPQNIILNQFDIPYITDFTHSFHLKNMNEERKSNIFKKISLISLNSPFIPIDVHFINFLYNETISLSKSNIQQICSKFFDEIIDSFKIFNNEELEKCKLNFFFSLQTYINKSKDDVIKDLLLNHSWYWDIYSLCMTYLFLLKQLDDSLYNCQFYLDFYDFLKKIIILLFSKREIGETITHSFLIEKFEKMLNNCQFDDLL